MGPFFGSQFASISNATNLSFLLLIVYFISKGAALKQLLG
jgi:hypothetical protein